MKQTTLSERATSEAAIALCSQSEVDEMVERVRTLPRPTPDDTRFPQDEWRSVAEGYTSALAVATHQRIQDPSLQRVLAAIAMQKSGYQDLIYDVVNVEVCGDVDSDRVEAIGRLLYHGFQKLPVATAALLAGWVPTVYVADEEQYQQRVGSDSPGYYHPDECWIAIQREPAWSDPRGWPRDDEGLQERYEHSTTLHELGHAVHYMMGLQTEGSETLDNRERERGDWKLTLRDEMQRATWQQEEFVDTACDAYRKLEQEEYETVKWSGYEESTVEEMVAEAYSVWVTAPLYLKSEWPLVWQMFESLP